MPKRQDEGAGTSKVNGAIIDISTLGILAEQLREVSDRLIITQSEVAEAKATAAESKVSTTALRVQVDSRKKQKTSAFQFSTKGNEIQFNTNVDIINDLTRALTALELGIPDEVNEHVKCALVTLQKRNKCIKLADKSPAGWALVDEYLGCELASDEEDDKRIKRAEAAVQLKYKRRLENNASRGNRGGRRGSYAGRGRYDNTPGAAHQHQLHHYANEGHYANNQYQGYAQNWTHGYAPVYPTPMQATGAPFYPGNGPHGQEQAGYHQRNLGPCFFCKGLHLRNACPVLAKQSASVQHRIEGAYQTQ